MRSKKEIPNCSECTFLKKGELDCLNKCKAQGFELLSFCYNSKQCKKLYSKKNNFKIEKDWMYKKYRCVVIMTSMGHKCGYVGITKKHFLYNKDYWSIPDFDVHGGITFSDGGKNSDYPIKSNLWWFGFDCAHASDAKDLSVVDNYIKEIEKKYPIGGILRSLNYCISECENLVDQLKLDNLNIDYNNKVKEFKNEN